MVKADKFNFYRHLTLIEYSVKPFVNHCYCIGSYALRNILLFIP